MLNENEVRVVKSILNKKDSDISLEDMDAMEAFLNKELRVIDVDRGRDFDIQVAVADDPLIEKMRAKFLRVRSKK